MRAELRAARRLCCLLVALLGLLAPGARAAEWTVRDEGSVLGFETRYESMTISGEFARFDARVRIDAADLGDARIDVRVYMADTEMGAAEGERMLARSEWFDPEQFPSARFLAERIEADGGRGRYTAVGRLRIKSREQGLRFPFEWTPLEGGRARLEGSAVVNRLDFDVGTGRWRDDDTIGPEVRIVVALELERP